jgi:hypothetical protein
VTVTRCPLATAGGDWSFWGSDCGSCAEYVPKWSLDLPSSDISPQVRAALLAGVGPPSGDGAVASGPLPLGEGAHGIDDGDVDLLAPAAAACAKLLHPGPVGELLSQRLLPPTVPR